jgi:hypothetical protein
MGLKKYKHSAFFLRFFLGVSIALALGLSGCNRGLQGTASKENIAAGVPIPSFPNSNTSQRSPTPKSLPDISSELSPIPHEAADDESHQNPPSPRAPNHSENEPLAGATYRPLQNQETSQSFLSFFSSSGRPRFGSSKAFQERLKQRFSERLNQAAPFSEKGERVFREIVHAVNREIPSPQAFMIISREEARRGSLETERNGGRGPRMGAWSIAVRQTAVRHGFARVPCAEFVSEVVRQAYARVSLDVVDDFNRSRKNQLIWHSTASVQNLGRALYRAGWVPWTTYEYRPPIGAIMLNGVGDSPGHAYFAAGLNGRFIVDNGAPQGRDLASGTASATIGMMFSSGVFFLPPGINPAKW